MFGPTPAPSSVLAFVTAIHAGLVVLRFHRGTRPGTFLLAIPSTAFAVLAWVLATPAWLGAVLATHVAWFVACEKLAPDAQRASPPRGAAAPPGPRAGQGASPPGERSTGFVAAPVLAVRDESDGIRTFRIGRPPGFTFTAGQFLTVQVHADGHAHVRCYSISSAPEASGYLEISVRRQGLVSGLLHSTVSAGMALTVRAPAGRFVYPAGDDRPIVLLGAGVGITPLMCMLRHGVAADPGRPITLLYSVRQPGDIAFRDELSLLVRLHPQIRVVITVTGETSADVYRRGRIDEALIRETVRDIAGSIFMLCGPLPMIEATREALLRLGAPSAQIRFEAFEAAAAVGAKLPGAAPGAELAGADQVTAHLKLSRSNQEIEVCAGESLLDAADKAGADIPSVCRSGVCGTCRTRLVSGRASCTSETLDSDDRANGYVLPCVTWPEGDCELEA
jgi:ferredoxin-NADP reductase